MKKSSIHLTFSIALILLTFNITYAENAYDYGDYTIHYNALQTTSLSQKIAQSYGITRSKNRGMLNITVLKKTHEALPSPVIATVSAHAKNLNNQIKTIEIREIREQDAIYYIAEFNISDGELLNFTLNINPENSSPQTIRFDKQFFTN